jgi:peptidoglycan hydrolase-like protein with peptidoglycan-binding domain
MELQDFLQDQGFLTGNVDGRFGFGTRKAVIAFQTANGLKADGYFGRASREKAASLLTFDNTTEIEETGTVAATSSVDGCTSTVGFSPLSGLKCDGTVTPVVTQNTIPVVTPSLPEINNSPVEVISPAKVFAPEGVAVGGSAEKGDFVVIENVKSNSTATLALSNGKTYSMEISKSPYANYDNGYFYFPDIVRNIQNPTSYTFVINFSYPDNGQIISGVLNTPTAGISI